MLKILVKCCLNYSTVIARQMAGQGKTSYFVTIGLVVVEQFGCGARIH